MLSSKLPASLNARKNIGLFLREPWRKERKAVLMNSSLEGVHSKNDPPAIIKAAAERVITAIAADVVIYTDVSADAGTSDGGAAAVITEGCTEFPEVTEMIMVKGAQETSS